MVRESGIYCPLIRADCPQANSEACKIGTCDPVKEIQALAKSVEGPKQRLSATDRASSNLLAPVPVHSPT